MLDTRLIKRIISEKQFLVTLEDRNGNRKTVTKKGIEGSLTAFDLEKKTGLKAVSVRELF